MSTHSYKIMNILHKMLSIDRSLCFTKVSCITVPMLENSVLGNIWTLLFSF